MDKTYIAIRLLAYLSLYFVFLVLHVIAPKRMTTRCSDLAQGMTYGIGMIVSRSFFLPLAKPVAHIAEKYPKDADNKNLLSPMNLTAAEWTGAMSMKNFEHGSHPPGSDYSDTSVVTRVCFH